MSTNQTAMLRGERVTIVRSFATETWGVREYRVRHNNGRPDSYVYGRELTSPIPAPGVHGWPSAL